MRTTVVIVTYRSKGVVERALDALAPIVEAGNAHCVVVDNASGDGTADHIAEHYGFVELIASDENLGFGRGCNAGLRVARSEFVLFLNPDASIDQASLGTLEAFFDAHPRAGLAGPAIQFEEGDYQPVWSLPTPLGLLASEGGIAPPVPREVSPQEAAFQTEWLSGAVIMGRRALLEELGGFDPRFFLYFEETDLCRRVREAGAELWLVSDARASHIGGASAEATDEGLWSGCIAQHYFESRHYYFTKHHGALWANAAALLELPLLAARSLLDWVRNREEKNRFWCRLQSPILRTPRHPSG